MKKSLLTTLILVFMFMGQVYATEETKIRYRILFDSKEEHEIETIQKMIQTYHELTLSVDKSDRGTILRQHLNKFDNENSEVSFEQGTLIIEMGDTKGSKIEGDFSFLECSPVIEETSWFMEWIRKEK